MKFERQDPQDKFLISGYSETTFRVAGKSQTGAVLVAPDYAEPAPIAVYEDFDARAVLRVLKQIGPIEVLLIGSGKAMQLFPSRHRQTLSDAGISVDVMDTGAAARTYNVLVMEDRLVACLLFPAGS
ncbi:MAG: Mth938-like domain-containing protein [Pseudomonadota bacterium]